MNVILYFIIFLIFLIHCPHACPVSPPSIPSLLLLFFILPSLFCFFYFTCLNSYRTLSGFEVSVLVSTLHIDLLFLSFPVFFLCHTMPEQLSDSSKSEVSVLAPPSCMLILCLPSFSTSTEQLAGSVCGLVFCCFFLFPFFFFLPHLLFMFFFAHLFMSLHGVFSRLRVFFLWFFFFSPFTHHLPLSR